MKEFKNVAIHPNLKRIGYSRNRLYKSAIAFVKQLKKDGKKQEDIISITRII